MGQRDHVIRAPCGWMFFGTVLRSCCSAEKLSLICGSLISAAFRGILQLTQNKDFCQVSHPPSLAPDSPHKCGGSEVNLGPARPHCEALPGGALYPTMIS